MTSTPDSAADRQPQADAHRRRDDPAGPGDRSRFTVSLDRLATLTSPLMGGSGDPGGPPRPLDSQADAQLRHAQKLALATGWQPAGPRFDNALPVALASLDLIAVVPHDMALVQDQAEGGLRRPRRSRTWPVADDRRPSGPGSAAHVELGDNRAGNRQAGRAVTRPRIELSVSRPAHALSIRVNPAQIEQAILNLCLNARDAMPDGGSLHITTRSAIRWIVREEGGGGRVPVTYAVVELSDTGRGIPPRLQAQVFEPFFTTKAPGQGSGLGLSMVRETVVAHGGLVELTSDPLGTTVRILLPLW